MICSSRPQTLADYIASIGDQVKVLNILVGDTQRIWIYADQGFAERQELACDAITAYQDLIAAGYTRRLVAP